MDALSSVSSSPVDNSTACATKQSSNTLTQQATRITVSQAQSTDIKIVTAEGDTVTLSANKTADLSYSTYNAHGSIDGKSVSVSAMSAEMHQTSAFSLTVDGDLNKEELKDIRRAIRIIEKSAHDVLTGHADKAASRTAKLAKLDQLASIDADVEFQQEVSVMQASSQSTSVPSSDSTDTPDPTPVSAPQPAPAISAEASTDASAPTATVLPADPQVVAPAPATSETPTSTHLTLTAPSL
ncbi:MAG TPA: hypothetical protein VK210_01985, partial [Terriglobia bacterium]|nr:hypothetical protein [Terriglobia bacterium]